MTPLLVALLLAAPANRAVSGPRAPPDADLSFFIPRLEQASGLSPFLDQAGEHSALFRKEGWRNDVHPLLGVDVFRRESLLDSGLDPAGSGTVSFRGEQTLSCLSLLDVKKYEAACAERLKTLGTAFRKEVDGVTVVGARDSLDRVLAGYVLKGKESCALSAQGKSIDKPLLELGKVLGKAPAGAMWKAASGLAGQGVLVAPQGSVGFKGAGLTLTEDFKSARLPGARLSGAGSSPYAGIGYDAMVWARSRIEPSQLPVVLAQAAALLMRACPACDRAALTDTATALAPTLSGNTLLFVQQVKVQGSLRTFNARFFAHRGAVLAEATDPKATRAALETLSRLAGARAFEEGYAMMMKDGELRIGVRGSHLYVSNDPRALEAVFKALPSAASNQPHGAEYAIDPERVAKALGQVPVMDVLSVPELAALIAISAEGGPLLLASEKLTGYADSDASGALKGQMVWTLKPAAPAAPK